VVEKDRILGFVEYAEPQHRDPDVDLLELFVVLGREIGQFLLRKAAEQERDLARGRLEKLVALNPAVLYSCVPDESLAILYMSPNIREHLGYEAVEFTRDAGLWFRELHEDDRGHVLTQVQSLFETGMMSLEYRFRHKNGEWRWMRDEAKVVRDAAGKPIEVVGYWTDDTSRHEAEQRFESILHHAPVLLFAKDLRGRYLFVNRATEVATGLESR
jgi:PAS domain S-box-containing protein